MVTLALAAPAWKVTGHDVHGSHSWSCANCTVTVSLSLSGSSRVRVSTRFSMLPMIVARFAATLIFGSGISWFMIRTACMFPIASPSSEADTSIFSFGSSTLSLMALIVTSVEVDSPGRMTWKPRVPSSASAGDTV